MENIKITLETLYDLLRNEKKREDLQKLEETFFKDVVDYLKEKQSFLNNSENDKNPFMVGEKEKSEYELKSIKRILKEIYEKREKKIIEITLNRSRTGSNIIDTSSMLKEEKEFYRRMLLTLDDFRNNILFKIFNNELPQLSVENSRMIYSEMNTKELKQEFKREPVEDLDTDPNKLIKIRLIHPVPQFIWKDLQNYGPYDIGEEVEIFSKIARLLIRKGRAKKV